MVAITQAALVSTFIAFATAANIPRDPTSSHHDFNIIYNYVEEIIPDEVLVKVIPIGSPNYAPATILNYPQNATVLDFANGHLTTTIKGKPYGFSLLDHADPNSKGPAGHNGVLISPGNGQNDWVYKANGTITANSRFPDFGGFALCEVAFGAKNRESVLLWYKKGTSNPKKQCSLVTLVTSAAG